MQNLEKTTIRVPISGNAPPHPRERGNGASHEKGIEELTKEMAKEAGERLLDWQAGFAALVNDVRGFYAKEVGKVITPINSQLAVLFNGLRHNIEQAPEDVRRDAEHRFMDTRQDALNYRERYAQFKEKLAQEREIFPNLGEEDVRKTRIKSSGDRLIFFGIMAVLVLVESGANTSLLSTAVEGGIVGAFVLATLISLINVMALGVGFGFLCAFLLRKGRSIFNAAMAVWFVLLVCLNFVVGAEREQLVRIIEAKENAAEAAAFSDSAGSGQLFLPGDLTDIPLNIFSWHFESFIFFILGIALCCFAFFKGITFIAPGANIKPVLIEIDDLKKKIDDNIRDIPLDSRAGLENIRAEVGQSIQNIVFTFRNATVTIHAMKDSWGGVINVIKTEFVNSYNNAHPNQKITMKALEEANSHFGTFPITEADNDALKRAKDLIEKYKETQQGEFYNEIRSVREKIAEMQTSFRSAIATMIQNEK